MIHLTIVGVPGSPYSRKLRAVLRYRRIPHAWVLPGSPESRGLPEPRVALLPRLILPGDDGALEARVDSTPLIRVLEGSHRGRSVVPPDPAMAFLDALLEDYADEWLTKPMFHYRWAFAPDAARAAAILPRWFRTNMPDDHAVSLGKDFSERQIGVNVFSALSDGLAVEADVVSTSDGRRQARAIRPLAIEKAE